MAHRALFAPSVARPGWPAPPRLSRAAPAQPAREVVSPRRDVSRQVPATQRFAERRSDRPVHLVGCAGLRAASDQLLVKPLQMLRLEPVEAVLAQAGDQVFDHRGAVGGVAGVAKVRLRDVLQPVDEPVSHGPALAGPVYSTLLAMPLQRSHLLHNHALALPAHMTTVQASVVPEADRHPPAPATVRRRGRPSRPGSGSSRPSALAFTPGGSQQPVDVLAEALLRDTPQPPQLHRLNCPAQDELVHEGTADPEPVRTFLNGQEEPRLPLDCRHLMLPQRALLDGRPAQSEAPSQPRCSGLRIAGGSHGAARGS